MVVKVNAKWVTVQVEQAPQPIGVGRLTCQGPGR